MTQYARPAIVPVWAESGDKVQPTDPELQIGWPLSNTPPSRQRFNWLLGFLAQGIRYLLQRGVGAWTAGEDYAQHALVRYNGILYQALISSPTAAPLGVAGEWEVASYSDAKINDRVDQILNKDVAGGTDVTLSAAEANNGILSFTGVLTANISVIIPNVARRFTVYNGTTGGFTLGVKTPAGVALVIPQGTSQIIYCNGTSTVRKATTDSSAQLIAAATVQYNAATTLGAAAAGRLNEFAGTTYSVSLPKLSDLENGNVIAITSNATGILTFNRQLTDQIQLAGAVFSSLTLAPGENLVLVAYPSLNLYFVLTSSQQIPGINQTYQNLTASRAVATPYTNNTLRPIKVVIGFGNGGVIPTVDGVTLPLFSSANNNTNTVYSFTVPPGKIYSITGGFASWHELR